MVTKESSTDPVSTLHMVTSEDVITDTPLPVVTVCATALSEQTNMSAVTYTPLSVAATTSKIQSAPLPMVTSHTTTQLTEQQSTLSSCHTPLPVVSLPAHVLSSPLPMATSTTTAALDNLMSTQSHMLKWSRVQNKLVEIDPSTLPKTPITEQSTDSTPLGDKPATDSTLSRKYYEVLIPQQDDIIFISHTDVINSRCSIRLDRISDEQILKLCEPKNDTLSTSTNSDSMEPPAVKRKPSYRPKHKPSKARVRAQKIITERNKNKQKEGEKLTLQALTTPPPPRTPAPVQEPKPEMMEAGDIHDSSDDTILYTPPMSPTRKKKRKQIAKFVI